MKKKAGKAKSGQLRWIGIWATIWWGISGLYIVLVAWLAKDYLSLFENIGWRLAIQEVFIQHPAVIWLLIFIVDMWLIGGVVWLRALKQAKISYKSAFRDLLLTLRW